jgi:hypothetical protein
MSTPELPVESMNNKGPDNKARMRVCLKHDMQAALLAHLLVAGHAVAL